MTQLLDREGVEPTEAEAAGRARVGARRHARVLIVDDEPLVRLSVRTALEDLGHEVVEAESARDALAVLAAQRDRVDVLLSDVMMPGVRGPALARQVVALWPHIRVIFMSSLPSRLLVDDGVMDAGSELLRKPIPEADLEAAMRRSLA